MSETDNLHTHSAPGPTHPPTNIFAQSYWKHAKRKRATTKTSAQYTKQQLKEGVLNGAIPSAAYDMACTSNAGMPPPPTKSFAQRYWKHAKRKRATTKTAAQCTKQQLKEGVLNGAIPSAAYDMACTSNAGMIGDPFVQTTQQSTKVLSVADCRQNPGSNIAKLHHPVHKPSQTADMVPALACQSLLSGATFAEAGYISVCDGKEVNLYDSRTARIVLSEDAVLKGWFVPTLRCGELH